MKQSLTNLKQILNTYDKSEKCETTVKSRKSVNYWKNIQIRQIPRIPTI